MQNSFFFFFLHHRLLVLSIHRLQIFLSLQTCMEWVLGVLSCKIAILSLQTCMEWVLGVLSCKIATGGVYTLQC